MQPSTNSSFMIYFYVNKIFKLTNILLLPKTSLHPHCHPTQKTFLLLSQSQHLFLLWRIRQKFENVIQAIFLLGLWLSSILPIKYLHKYLNKFLLIYVSCKATHKKVPTGLFIMTLKYQIYPHHKVQTAILIWFLDFQFPEYIQFYMWVWVIKFIGWHFVKLLP